MTLTVISMGFGTRAATAGIVTMGFGTLGATLTNTKVISGVRKQIRVRRSDFSSQANYEFALRAAMAGANVAVRPDDVEPPKVEKKPPKKAKPKTDTAIAASAESLFALQRAAEMDEMELVMKFIAAIESEW